MGVIGIETIDVGADATALAGPGEPPLGALMPFVAQNPLGPFIPGDQYQIRSEDEGECGTGALDSHLADLAGASGVSPWPRMSSRRRRTGRSRHSRRLFPWRVPGASTFTTSISVTLSAKGNGATIHYTTDGSTPTAASPAYSAPLTFTATTTLKAIAGKNGEVSEIGTFNYTQANPPAAVTATPGDGQSFTSPFTVTLSVGRSGPAAIYYTINGTDPVVGAPGTAVYGSPIPVSSTTQIRAMARGTNGMNSAITAFNYTPTGGTQPPVANPVSGTEFATTLNVSLTTPTPGATIWYTVNGSDPRTSPSGRSTSRRCRSSRRRRSRPTRRPVGTTA